MDLLLFATSITSALVAYVVSLIFIRVYILEKNVNRLIWALAFFLYACGHTIVSLIALSLIPPNMVVLFMWIYVTLGGAGTVGLILYSMLPFLTDRPHLREVSVFLYVLIYIIGTAMYAFFLPADTVFAIINPFEKTQLNNMSWLVVILIIPASLLISYIFLNHYRIIRVRWSLLVGLSFLMYALILPIWAIESLKPLFYILRVISVGLLGAGGTMLAREGMRRA